MTAIGRAAVFGVAMALGACEGTGGDLTRDGGFDSKQLSDLKAGIWIDPNGCDHWIIDDGIEGYLTARLDPYGKPVCSGAGAPGQVIGEFQSGSILGDPI